MKTMSERAVTVKVPGKLFIAGEYAVTIPGHLALVAAIETDFFVTILSSSEKQSCLRTNVGFPDYLFDLEKLNELKLKKENPWNLTLRTLQLLQAQKKFYSGQIVIEIKSDLGAGNAKKGYGSSASLVCAVVKALNKFYSLNLSLAEQFQLAGQAHYEIQGNGSLGDVAAIIYGGSIFYQSARMTATNQPIEYEIRPISLPWMAYVIQTGKAVKTQEKLKIDLSEDFLRQSDELVNQLLHTKKFVDFKRLLLANQDLLITNLPSGYLTEKLSLALKMINLHPRLAGKVSGAGFGENLLVFADQVSKGEIDLLGQALEEHEMKLEKINVAAQATN